MRTMEHLIVVAAILINNDEILCAQRGKSEYDYISQKYEFPGGTVEPGETLEIALVRELEEELLIRIDRETISHFLTVEHTYPDFSVSLHSFLCPVESRAFVKTEHLDCQWLPCDKLNKLDWATADIPIVNKLVCEGYGHGFGEER